MHTELVASQSLPESLVPTSLLCNSHVPQPLFLLPALPPLRTPHLRLGKALSWRNSWCHVPDTESLPRHAHTSCHTSPRGSDLLVTTSASRSLEALESAAAGVRTLQQVPLKPQPRWAVEEEEEEEETSIWVMEVIVFIILRVYARKT